MDESDLIVQAQQDDGTAWERLICQHQTAVFRLAYLLLGDADDADDVAQETFIRAFGALDRFDASRPLRPWLLRITTNLAYNRRRALGRYLAAARRMFQSTPEAVITVEGQSSQRWESQTLWQAVRRLSAVDQQIIYLRYFLDLSEAEMAATLNIASGTVKSRLHRAMSRLRVVVEREFPGLREVRDV